MARVVVVDDDASIRRLVELSLEGLPLDLVLCAGAQEARAAFESAPVALLITDLMMPGESGYELLQWLVERPQLRGQARLVAFSAGIDGAARERLARLDVWRELGKPVSVAALEACVAEALGLDPARGSPPALPPPLAAAPDREAEARRAVIHQFGGDETLYRAFRAQATSQFEADLAEGDRLLAGGDDPALHRLAHSLKGVLALLGHEADAALALALERAAASGARAACQQAWPVLRSALSEVITIK
jgi:CheY-like chemotaxis protein